MEIRLDSLTLEHFKGVKSFTLFPDGAGRTTVRGPNGSGKTTLMDGFLWLLFGKDSTGRADFSIKTLDAAGLEINNLNHAVQAVLSVTGVPRPITLQKVYSEKWTKKRGSAAKEFSGHTTDHFIDGVPIQAKEWKQRIDCLVDEETFRLLTNPGHFAALHWQKRREILLQVCGDVGVGEVIASDAALRDLPEILGDRTQEEHRKVLAAKRREINGRLTEIPARIDELYKTSVEVYAAAYDRAAIEAREKTLSEQIQALKVDNGAAQLRAERADLAAQVAECRVRLDAARREAESGTQREIRGLEDYKNKFSRDALNAAQAHQDAERIINRNEQKMSRLREEFAAIAGQEYSGKTSCPTCGQPLPADQVESARQKHNEQKASALADINKDGTRLKIETGEARKEAAKQAAKRDESSLAVQECEAKIHSLNEQRTAAVDAAGQAEHEQIATLGQKIVAIDAAISSRVAPDTSAIEAELAVERQKLAAIDGSVKATKRIETLKKEEKKLAAEFEELERQAALLDRFVVAKVNLLEGKINSRFGLVRFKMFDTQVNGGISECCEATVNGVPFSSANTGSQILAGLDVINTLSGHYGIKAPVFLDHAEALSAPIPPLACQLIALKVSEGDGLVIEHK